MGQVLTRVDSSLAFLSFANAAVMLVTEDGNDCQEQSKAFQVHILPQLHSQQQRSCC